MQNLIAHVSGQFFLQPDVFYSDRKPLETSKQTILERSGTAKEVASESS